MHTLAVFASGAGSNTQKIIDYFKDHHQIRTGLVVCNKPQAGVLQIAEQAGIPTLLVQKETFFTPPSCVDELRERGIDFIVLAGFLWKIPPVLIEAYSHRIINIHPALLPHYGGKGMYGAAVHEAVIKSGDPESGITIHYVDDQYDHGETILQVSCPIEEGETPETLATKIHQLEHYYYPRVIEECLEPV
ncbi:MAG: phosphoribosylglycinamide formyltransferase [Williamsia sp.]|nr:phosphoribosylglycinamide formyltransferase [Williamsia sp.]